MEQKGRPWPRARIGAFAIGIGTVVIATQSPLAYQDTRLFSAHVVQHILLAMVAPAFFCLSAPITLFLQASTRKTQSRILKVLHHPLSRFITFPLIGWMLFVGTLFALYYS